MENNHMKKAPITSEEKKAAAAARRKITKANYYEKNRESINAYMNNVMKEKYKNDEVYRNKEIERGKLRYRKLVEQRRLDVLAKESTTATTEKNND